MNRLRIFLGLFFSALVLFSVHCSQKKKASSGEISDNTVIARVDNRNITVHDFKLSYELFPYMLRPHGGEKAKMGQLKHMIQRILFAREAEKKGYGHDPQIEKYIDFYRKQVAIKQLYRDVVKKRVTVSEAEVRDAYLKSLTQYHVRHIFAKTYAQAAAILNRLEAGESWNTIARQEFHDSTLAKNGGDLGWVSWGDMEENLEKEMYKLKPNEISPPVRSKWGYHILQVLDIRKEMIPTEYDFQNKRKDLENRIRRRKERQVAVQFVKKIMVPKHVILKGKAFHYLNREFQALFSDNPKLPPYMPNIFDNEIQQAHVGLKAHLGDTLLTFKGGVWTIGDFLQKLKDIPVANRPVYRNSKKLYNDIGILLRNETLAKIALKKRLDRRPEAQKEFAEKRDDVLYSKMLMVLLDTVQVTDADVRKYYQTHPEEFTEPEKVNIREILLRTRPEAEKILQRIRNGEDMAALAKKYSIRQWAAKRGGEFGYFSKNGHGKLGEIAVSLPVGTLYGPLEIAGGPPHGGYSVFKVIGKRPPHKLPFSKIKDDLKQRLLQNRRSAVLNQFTQKLKKKFYVKARYDLLKKVKTIDDNNNAPLLVMPIQNF